MTRYRRRGGEEPEDVVMSPGPQAAAPAAPAPAAPAPAAPAPAAQGFAGVGAQGVVNADEDANRLAGRKRAREEDNVGANGGRRRHSRRRHHRHRKTLRAVPKGVHVKAKTLKKLLKSKGLKVSGKKATLRARARKAHLIRGGAHSGVPSSSPATV